MNRYLKWIIFGMLGLLLGARAVAEEPPREADRAFFDLKQQIEAHYFTYDEQTMSVLLDRSRGLIELYAQQWYPHYFAGIINTQLGNIVRAVDKRSAYHYYIAGLEHLQRAYVISPNPENSVVLARVYGKLASLRSLKMIYHGQKAKSFLIDAFQMEAMSPKNHLLAGIQSMWTPRIFGGSKERARELFTKAMALEQAWTEPDRLVVSWASRPEISAHLAQLDILCGDNKRARERINGVLEAVPQYGFVKRDLLPQLK